MNSISQIVFVLGFRLFNNLTFFIYQWTSYFFLSIKNLFRKKKLQRGMHFYYVLTSFYLYYIHALQWNYYLLSSHNILFYKNKILFQHFNICLKDNQEKVLEKSVSMWIWFLIWLVIQYMWKN